MKARLLVAVLGGLALIIATVSPPGGVRYFSYSAPPNPDVIRALARSHLSLVSDLFWIRTIATSVALRVPADGRTLIAWADLVSELDPKFIWPYLLGGLLGPMTFGATHYNVKEGNALLQKGIDAIPGDYRLPMYLSYNQLHLEHDLPAAAETLRKGARTPNAPEFMGKLATRLLAQTNAFESARAFAEELEQSSPDPEVREFFKRRKLEVQRDEVTARLQVLVDGYRQQRGRPPLTLDALVAEQVLPSLPEDPLGGVFYLDADGRVKSTSGERLEAKFPKGSP